MRDVEITASGPLFDGQLKLDLDRFGDDVVKILAREAESTLRGFAARNFRTHPTYRWERELNTTRAEGGMVLSNPVIYNAWLEGVGSRNFPKTRFRGYRIWRKTWQALLRSAPDIVEARFRRYAEKAGIEVR
jgi:hypothetical protein